MHFIKFVSINLTAVLGAAWMAAALDASAGDWPQWRGPNFNGSTDEKGLPSKWTKESAKWTAAMPGPGAATPVVLGDRVYVSTTDSKNRSLHAMCLDRASGRVIWDNTVGDGLGRDNRSTFASPSPIASAERAYFFFGNGSLVAFDTAGKEVWSRSITKDYGDFAFQWTFGATPLLHGGKLYVQVLQRDVPVNGRGRREGPIESFILALDPATGKSIWKHVRPNEAVQESKESYGTPMPFTFNGRSEILITGGDCVTGHNPDSGEELWRWGTWNPNKIGHWLLVPSPMAGAGVVLACAPKGSPIYAIKAGGKGTLDDSAIAWASRQKRELTSDVSTPLLYQGDFFILKEEQPGVLSRINPATGDVKWSRELPGRRKWEASPTGADGKIYVMNFAGDVAVVDAGNGEVLGTNPMGDDGDDMNRSTVAAARGSLFIRTNNKLYCVAGP